MRETFWNKGVSTITGISMNAKLLTTRNVIEKFTPLYGASFIIGP
jgi:hypothetical protein